MKGTLSFNLMAGYAHESVTTAHVSGEERRGEGEVLEFRLRE